MISSKSVLCLLPARKGSQGLQNKNYLNIAGKHLIEYPLIAAKKSKYIDKIIVSTDNDSIINFVNKKKLFAPFKRPSKYSKNNSLASDVIIHALKWVEQKLNYEYDYIVYLEPTSPFTTSKDIDTALKSLFDNKNAKCIVSVTKSIREHSVFNYKIDKNKMLIPQTKNKPKRRQDLNSEYYLDGSFYISETNYYKKYKNFFTKNTMTQIQEKFKSFEIDDEIDLICVSAIMKSNLYKNEK